MRVCVRVCVYSGFRKKRTSNDSGTGVQTRKKNIASTRRPRDQFFFPKFAHSGKSKKKHSVCVCVCFVFFLGAYKKKTRAEIYKHWKKGATVFLERRCSLVCVFVFFSRNTSVVNDALLSLPFFFFCCGFFSPVSGGSFWGAFPAVSFVVGGGWESSL